MNNLVIFKYFLAVVDKQTIEMPKGAKILSVQEQNKQICIWAEVPVGNDTEPRTFEMFPTGMNYLPGNRTFIGTLQLLQGKFVCHIFEAL